jgi:hypothetical protein
MAGFVSGVVYKEKAVAEIDMRPDTVSCDVWWVFWVEREEIVARIDQDSTGACTVTPQGPHRRPMKSFRRSFDSPTSALREVQLYFGRR